MRTRLSKETGKSDEKKRGEEAKGREKSDLFAKPGRDGKTAALVLGRGSGARGSGQRSAFSFQPDSEAICLADRGPLIADRYS